VNHDRVLERVYVGSFPESARDIDRLKHELDISAVLNLQTDEDYERLDIDWPWLQAYYRQSGIEVCRAAVRDFDPDDLQEKLPACVEALRRLLAAGHTVYVHCTAGAGRSPNVVIAYLHWVEQWDLDEAIEKVADCRPCVPDRAVILRAGRGQQPGSPGGGS
jgi:protein-tyrosine phosphatase